jgi:Xaa-Pro aminopeptidase
LINKLLEVITPQYDAALIISPVNRRYFTRFDSSDGFLIVSEKGSVFFTDGRYIEAAQKTVTVCDCVEAVKPYEQIREYFNKIGAKRIAVEGSKLTVAQYERLKERLPEFEFFADKTLDLGLDGLRRVKTAKELEFIKAAQKTAEDAFQHILTVIKEGVTERELALELDFYMLKAGAEELSFKTIAVSGANSSMPHGVPSDKKLQKGDMITLDFGAVCEGYHSDMTRTVVLGKANSEQKKVYNTVLKAQNECLSMLRAGVKCSDADKAARSVIEKAGYGDFFSHSTGHGVGLEIHEEPRLSSLVNDVLKSGNVVTVEPGIYIPGKFGVRIEDMAYITDDGIINLTSSPKELIEL